MQIKEIAKDDISIIKNLWKNLNVHHLSKSTNFKDQFSQLTFEKRMDGLKQKDRFICYVIEEKSQGIGYCIATVEGRSGEVDSLFVEASHRGKGAGEKLVSLALAWLQEQGCETIRLLVAEGNENVLGFYRRFGFAERFIVMQKKASSLGK